MMTRDYELIDSIEMIEKAIQRMDIAENGTCLLYTSSRLLFFFNVAVYH